LAVAREAELIVMVALAESKETTVVFAWVSPDETIPIPLTKISQPA